MKFLCVPCDSPMKLQTVGPPERGSLSVVYACPECGYEMAMLTNAYETQIVQSLGVRIGPETGAGASNRLRAAGASASPAGASAETGESGSRCPFSAMIPASDGVGGAGGAKPPSAERMSAANEPRERRGALGAPASERVGGSGGAKPPGVEKPGEPIPVRWTPAAEARLEKVPAFVRPMARTGIERFARENGAIEVDEKILDAAREFFGM